MTEKIYIRKDRWTASDGSSLPHPWVVSKGRPSYNACGHWSFVSVASTSFEDALARAWEMYGD